MRYFREPPPDRSALRQRGRMIRSLRTRDIDLAVDHLGEIGVTVELSNQFSISRRSRGRTTGQIGAVGNITLDPPGHPLDLSIRGDCRVVQLALPIAVFREIAGEDHDREGASLELSACHGEQDPTLFHLVCQAAVQAEFEGEEEVLRSIVAHLLNAHASKSPVRLRAARAGISPTRLHRLRELVEENLATVTVAQMAAITGLSPFHFSREFKRSTDRTPWEYVTSRRLARAIGQLADRSMPISQIALAAGFASASHLTHRMKAFMGASPTAIRTKLLI